MDVKGGQRHAQDLLQVNNLFVCLFVNPNGLGQGKDWYKG